jgi:transcriptional antiterminator
MEETAIVTIKFSEAEVNILINSLENTLDTKAVFTVMPKKYNTLLEDLKKIKKMIEEKKHESLIDKKDYNGPKSCDNCED